MDLNEYYLLLIVLTGFMILTNQLYRGNYWIHGFWLLMNTWYAVIAMNQNTSNLIFGLIIACFNVMLNIFYIEESYHKRVKN